MRVKYYALTLRQMSLKKSFVFFLISLIFVLVSINIYIKKIEPTIKTICSNNARNIAIKCSNEAIYKNTENITYDNLITVNKDSSGKVTSLSANSSQINKLTSKIVNDIENNLQDNIESKITIPLGMFFNESFVSGYGPKIKIKTYPIGDIKAELKSKFESAGINQTRHSLILEINADVRVLAPFVSQTEEYTNSIVIAETVIVSDTPSSYYNITGVEGVNSKDTLDLLE